MKKFSITSSIDRMSLDKRIKSMRFLEFFLDHSWTLILVFAVNAVFSWFAILGGKVGGLFDIITLVLFPILMIVGEFAIIFFAAFAEICAEMVSDTIFPRYTKFPEALLVRNDSSAAINKAAKTPVASTPAAATQQTNPRYAGNGQQNAPKTPPVLSKGNGISLTERLKKLQNEPEYKLTSVIAPAVRAYVDEMLEEGSTVSTSEQLQLWLVITRLIAIDRTSVINDRNKFISNSVDRITKEIPDIANDFSVNSMMEEFYRIDAIIIENKAQANDERDEFTRELIWSLATFLNAWDREDETGELLTGIVQQAIEDAAALN